MHKHLPYRQLYAQTRSYIPLRGTTELRCTARACLRRPAANSLRTSAAGCNDTRRLDSLVPAATAEVIIIIYCCGYLSICRAGTSQSYFLCTRTPLIHASAQLHRYGEERQEQEQRLCEGYTKRHTQEYSQKGRAPSHTFEVSAMARG